MAEAENQAAVCKGSPQYRKGYQGRGRTHPQGGSQSRRENKADRSICGKAPGGCGNRCRGAAALNIYNGIIQGEAKELPTIQEFSQLSEQELDRIETLVQSLLKITKLDAGTIILEKSLENVSELAKNIKKHFLFRAEQEGKEICLSGNEEIKLLCDRNWIIEAISNLVKNALDHTEKGGLIRIEWRAFTSIVQISVKDNGSGIHPDDLYHIFKRFYRSRFSKDTQGIGLGLSLTKAIVEAHNGTIEVDSTVGMGTSFTINFLNPTKL